jgi:O-antigen ligase
MEFLLAIAVPAALLWAAVFLRFAGLWGCLVALLPIGSVLGYEFYHVSVITSDRVLTGVCVCLAALGRWWGITRAKPWNLSDFWFACFIGVVAVSTVAAVLGGGGSPPIAKLLFFFLLPACLYVVAREVEITPGRLLALYAVLALFGLYLAGTSVAEKYGLEWAIYPKYIVTSANQEFLGRGRGPLLNPSANGVLLALGLSCWLMFYPLFGKFGRLILTGGVGVYLAGIYCTMTRCVWMGGAAVLGGIIYATLPKRLRLPFVVTTLIAGTLFVGANLEKFKSFKRDKNVDEAGMRESAQLRPILAVVAWKMFLDHPIAGVGTGQYTAEAKYYLQDRDVDLPLEKARPYVQHNIFLSILTENGLLGLIPFLAILTIWSRDAWRLWNRQDAPLPVRQFGLVFLGALAGYLCNGMFQDVLIMQMINNYFFFLAGCLRNVAAQDASAWSFAAPLSTQRLATADLRFEQTAN